MSNKQITNMRRLKLMTPEKLARKLDSILQGKVLYRTLDGQVRDFGAGDNNQKPNNNPGAV